MAQTVLITLTTAGLDTGPFDLYSDADGYITPFEIGVGKGTLVAGYTCLIVPDAATIIRICSVNSDCTNCIDLPIVTSTTTTTSTSTSTTTTSTSTSTSTTSTTSTTTTALNNYTITRYICGTCVVDGTGVLDGSLSLINGKYYYLDNGQIGQVTGLTTDPVTHTLLSSTAYDDCIGLPC